MKIGKKKKGKDENGGTRKGLKGRTADKVEGETKRWKTERRLSWKKGRKQEGRTGKEDVRQRKRGSCKIKGKEGREEAGREWKFKWRHKNSYTRRRN